MAVMCIKARREAAGLGQAQLATQMGVVQGAVANWGAEISLPKARDLPRLAKVLGCSIDDLYAQEGEAGPERSAAVSSFDPGAAPESYDTAAGR